MNDPLEQYKSYLQDFGNIGARRQTRRGFYVTLISALTAFLALGKKADGLIALSGNSLPIAGLVGIAICLLWAVHMLANGAHYRATFKVLGEMEAALAVPMFARETALLQADREAIRLTRIDITAALVFAVLFIVSIAGE